MKSYNACFSIAACFLVLCAGTYPTRAAETDEFKKLLEEKSRSLVTVKFVLKVQMGGMMGGMGDEESESEATGVLIDPKGIVLCANSQLEGFTGQMRRMMGDMGGSITATPTDLKVLIGDDTEGREAELMARDTELDLAWVRIKEPGDEPLPHIDLNKAAEKPQIGQRIFTVRRMGKYFGRSIVIADGQIGGITTKPRELYVPSNEAMAALGLPVYTPDGQVIGVLITQVPEADDSGMSNPMMMMSSLSSMQDMMAGLILPAKDVAKATERALSLQENP